MAFAGAGGVGVVAVAGQQLPVRWRDAAQTGAAEGSAGQRQGRRRNGGHVAAWFDGEVSRTICPVLPIDRRRALMQAEACEVHPFDSARKRVSWDGRRALMVLALVVREDDHWTGIDGCLRQRWS